MNEIKNKKNVSDILHGFDMVIDVLEDDSQPNLLNLCAQIKNIRSLFHHYKKTTDE